MNLFPWLKRGVVLGALVTLSGCMDPVMLQNPTTGQIEQCFAAGPFPLIAQHQCVVAHENLGWIRTTPAEAQAAQTARIAERDTEISSAINECREARLRGELKSYVASVQCSNPRIREASLRFGNPFMDLLDIELATRLADAEKIDKGQMTEAEAGLHIAQVHAQMTDEARHRVLEAQAAQNQTSMAHSAETQAQGALLSGMGAWNASTRGITCTSFGTAHSSTTNCY